MGLGPTMAFGHSMHCLTNCREQKRHNNNNNNVVTGRRTSLNAHLLCTRHNKWGNWNGETLRGGQINFHWKLCPRIFLSMFSPGKSSQLLLGRMLLRNVASVGIDLKQLGGGRCRNVWNFAQGLKFKTDFYSKWASVDINWGFNPQPLGNSNLECSQLWYQRRCYLFSVPAGREGSVIRRHSRSEGRWGKDRCMDPPRVSDVWKWLQIRQTWTEPTCPQPPLQPLVNWYPVFVTLHLHFNCITNVNYRKTGRGRY